MADPVGLTASIIAIAGLAYQRSKALYELLNGIQNAPKTLQVLNDDLSAIQHLLKSIRSAMEDSSDDSFSNSVKKCLEEGKPALVECGKACDEFAEKMGKIMSHSDANHTSARDRIKLQFQEKDILAFRYRIGSYKATLNIALSLTSLKTTSQNQNSVREFQSTIENTMSGISGQIQGLEISMHAVAESAPDKSEAILKALEEHNMALGQCLKACTSALAETSKETGTTVKYAEALDEARQLMANIGTVDQSGGTVRIDKMIAKNHAWQVAGNLSTDAALAILTAPSRSGAGNN